MKALRTANKDIRALYTVMQYACDELKEALIARVAATPSPVGVQQLNQSTCVVSVSTIRSNGFVLSPDYYQIDEQVAAITQAITSAGNIETMEAKIQQILDTGYVNSSRQARIRLHPNALEVLQSIMTDIRHVD